MKIPPRRRKTAYSSLRRIAKRIGVHFALRRLNHEEEKSVEPVDPASQE